MLFGPMLFGPMLSVDLLFLFDLVDDWYRLVLPERDWLRHVWFHLVTLLPES